MTQCLGRPGGNEPRVQQGHFANGQRDYARHNYASVLCFKPAPTWYTSVRKFSCCGAAFEPRVETTTRKLHIPMKSPTTLFASLAFALFAFSACNKDDEDTTTTDTRSESRKEADALMQTAAQQRGMSTSDFAALLTDRSRFNAQQNVFFPSALAVNYTTKHVTLPLYKGIGPSGAATYFIITECADFDLARLMGVNYAPKLANGRGTAGVQNVTMESGMIKFKGEVDFSPVRTLAPGPFPMTFPPSVAIPGSVGDAEYSPLIIMPSGLAMSVSIVANASGTHDHLVSMDQAKGTVVFELLDGFENGKQFYYHLVTESSDMGAATIERGTYTPRLANLPAFGKSGVNDKSSALLGFAPCANGETGANNPERQGLNSTILDGNAFDPINVFPLDPQNDKKDDNNYSPMWDAHIYAWTDAAIAGGQRRQVKSMSQLQGLLSGGSVMNAPPNSGDPNPVAAGLKATGVIINCPVIAQPDL